MPVVSLRSHPPAPQWIQRRSISVLGSLLDYSLSGIEVSECQLFGPAQARGGLPFVMSQLAKSVPVVS
ncbi:hypothetical protein [Sporosarcina sp. P33]|uniref:hypothetical protein n=1 Tax=Sporosarcina sp. P33 TaxID=1930764 RepID=UPI0012DF90BA|nr:hypothetical protein [Sporosarcina sp. P33]